MTGKEKCEKLKKIRKILSDANGLEYNPSVCTFEGDCSGTCPQCEAELKSLSDELLRRVEEDGYQIKGFDLIDKYLEDGIDDQHKDTISNLRERAERKNLKSCTNCGAKIPLSSRFCRYCGTKVSIPCVIVPNEHRSAISETTEFRCRDFPSGIMGMIVPQFPFDIKKSEED